MNRIIRVGKQILVVALVAGVAAYLGASAALKTTQAKSLERPNMLQLVEGPKPCTAGC